MSTTPKFDFSKIKNVYIPIFKYNIDHGPTSQNGYNENFTGRERLLERIQLLFSAKESGSSEHGAYLMTGYRGVGKTSAVREAFNRPIRNPQTNEVEKDKNEQAITFKAKNNLEIFSFALSQDEVKDVDLLRQIGIKLIDFSNEKIFGAEKYKDESRLNKEIKNEQLWKALPLFLSLFFTLIIFTLKFKVPGFILDWVNISLSLNGVGLTFLFFSIWIILNSLFKIGGSNKNGNKSEERLKKHIKLFEKRIYSSVIFENAGSSNGINLGTTNPYSYISDRLFNLQENSEKKNTQNFEKASPKEIEYYISQILECIHEIRKERKEINKNEEIYNLIPEFVFIVDELDKIEPDYHFAPGDNESDEYLHHNETPFHIVTKARRRQEAIAKLLGNLKSFLNDVKAKFIFIGGRDMFDASLADISDRESFYSSIFNEVIYVETFFKDKINNNAGLSHLAEKYIFQFLFPRNIQLENANLSLYSKAINTASKEENFKVLHLLQNFFIFLLYRSNGSPKKLIELMERYIVEKESVDKYKLKSELCPTIVSFKFSDANKEVLEKEIDRLRNYIESIEECIAELKIKGQSCDDLLFEARRKSILETCRKCQNIDNSLTGHELKQSFLAVKKILYRELKIEKIKELLSLELTFLESKANEQRSFLREKTMELKNLKDMIQKQSDLYHSSGIPVSYYLHFSYKNQYEINLTSHLYRPYTIINSKHLKSLGDKLLFSSAFLMDHILKFHRSAFSWRNLEMIPDIILANKEPNFRQFFENLISFLGKQHLRQTLNAIFQYKFHNKVKNELEFLSKTSEFSSAAFNFTLDESYHLKSYYKKKLAGKYLEYKNNSSFKSGDHYIHSIGYLHSLIGDLHYYDEEYDDAVIHYTDAIQPMRTAISEGRTLINHQFVLYCRNQLALGLCLEKIRSYDKAYSIYRSLILSTKGFNSSRKIEPGFREWEAPYKRILLFLRPHIALLGVIEKKRNDGITYDNLVRNISEYASFLKMDNLGLFPSKENNIINYKSIEKSKERKFLSVVEVSPSSDKKRLVTLFVDYYVSVGSMLFFKNQLFYRLLFCEQSLSEEISLKIVNIFKEEKEKKIVKMRNSYFPSHSAYLYYYHALAGFNSPYVENYNIFFDATVSDEKQKSSLFTEIQFLNFFLEKGKYSVLNSKEYETLANIIGKLGDSLLGCVFNKVFDTKILERFYSSKKVRLTVKDKKLFTSLSLNTVFALYRISNEFYLKAGNIYEASFQLKKVLYILRDSVNPSMKNKAKVEKTSKWIAQIILNDLSEISNASNRAQINKYRYYIEENDSLTSNIYRGQSTEVDVKEVVATVEIIRMKLDKDYIPAMKVGCNNTISSMFSRILELKLKSKSNLRYIKNSASKAQGIGNDFFKESKKIFFHDSLADSVEVKKFSDFLTENINRIADGLFCNVQMIKILNTYGVNYILNYSFLGSVHRSLSLYSIFYQILKKNEAIEELEKLANDLIGPNSSLDFDPFYHLDLSIHYNKKAISLHSEGKYYKEIARSMFALDDDFNDNLTHFCAALERFRINNQSVQDLIEKDEKDLSQTKMRKYESYI